MATYSAVPHSIQADGDQAFLAGAEYSGQAMKVIPFSYTHAIADGTDEINLVTLPAGRILVMPELSSLSVSALETAADLHLGHRAYTQSDGTAVAEDDNEWLDNVDSGGGAVIGPWSSGVGVAITGSVEQPAAVYDTKDGLTLFVMVDTANIEIGDTISGHVVFTSVP